MDKSSERTIDSTPAPLSKGPVAPKNSKRAAASVWRRAFTSAAAWASPEASPATIMNRHVSIGAHDTSRQ